MNKIKILFLAANPVESHPLKLDEEIRAITAKIQASEYRDALELISVWAVRPDDLLQALNQHKPQVVHFSGHGTQSGEIVVVGEDGQPKPIGTKALRALFRTLKDNVRVVVMNACFSRPQARAITRTIDCAVGMNASIGDRAATIFAASFYRAIGFGRSVQEAFEQGKTALLLEGVEQAEVPELLVRTGVDPGQLVLVDSTSQPPADKIPLYFARTAVWDPAAIEVNIFVQSRGKTYTVRVTPDVFLDEFVDDFVDQIGLSKSLPDGRRIRYYLYEQGSKEVLLSSNASFRQNRVQDGDTVNLVLRIHMGAK